MDVYKQLISCSNTYNWQSVVGLLVITADCCCVLPITLVYCNLNISVKCQICQYLKILTSHRNEEVLKLSSNEIYFNLRGLFSLINYINSSFNFTCRNDFQVSMKEKQNSIV